MNPLSKIAPRRSLSRRSNPFLPRTMKCNRRNFLNGLKFCASHPKAKKHHREPRDYAGHNQPEKCLRSDPLTADSFKHPRDEALEPFIDLALQHASRIRAPNAGKLPARKNRFGFFPRARVLVCRRVRILLDLLAQIGKPSASRVELLGTQRRIV